jgi:hypothetical protein
MIALLRTASGLPCGSVMPALLLPIGALTASGSARNMHGVNTIAALETLHAQ